MGRALQNLPFRQKLTLALTATCAIVLTFACATLFLFQFVSIRRTITDDLTSVAKITAANTTGAVAFHDEKAAQEVLRALEVKPEIFCAHIVLANGREFAHYGADSEDIDAHEFAEGEATQFADGQIILSHPILLEGKRLGTLVIRSDFTGTRRHLLRLYGGLLAAVLAGSLILVLLLAGYIQKAVAKPILDLTETARRVSEQKDYSVRALRSSDDELGVLTDTFNQMLTRIQANDEILRKINSTLQEEVSERTRAQNDLRQSQQRYEVAVMGSSDGLWDWNLETHELYFSPRWKSMLGYGEADFPNTLDGWKSHLHPSDRERVLQVVDDYLSAPAGKVYEVEFRMRHQDGSYRWILSRGAALLGDNGHAVRFAGSHTDITTRKQAEEELDRMNKQLVNLSHQAGMAEVATGVLHNVGNVLNSVNVSATLVVNQLEQSKLSSLSKAVELMRQHEGNLGDFLQNHPKGSKLLGFLDNLTQALVGERDRVMEEAGSMSRHVQHIKEIVAMQQSFARVSGLIESLQPAELLADALHIHQCALDRHGIRVLRNYSAVPAIAVDRHKVLQILINLIGNAKHAVTHSRSHDRLVTLSVTSAGPERVRISIEDNGVGIAPENMTRIFQHGFTTKKDGHGFGLHSGANAAAEMNGTLTARSDGIGLGACFDLELPVAQGQTRPTIPNPTLAA
jgi:PAS domain S-box-containing protein